MIGLSVNVANHFDQLAKEAERARAKSLRRAAFLIYQDSQASITPSPDPSQPGQPPHTRDAASASVKVVKGKRRKRVSVLPKAIVYAADKDEAVIGPRASVVGLSAAAHEKGGEFKGEEFPARPFMVPALDRQIPAFLESFQHSIGA